LRWKRAFTATEQFPWSRTPILVLEKRLVSAIATGLFSPTCNTTQAAQTQPAVKARIACEWFAAGRRRVLRTQCARARLCPSATISTITTNKTQLLILKMCVLQGVNSCLESRRRDHESGSERVPIKSTFPL